MYYTYTLRLGTVNNAVSTCTRVGLSVRSEVFFFVSTYTPTQFYHSLPTVILKAHCVLFLLFVRLAWALLSRKGMYN